MTNRPKKGEIALLERIERLLAAPRSAARSALRVSLGDDAAVFRPRAGHETILTCDWFLEGTHFRSDRHPPESVAAKCLARAASDIAAMGGQPRCFLLSLALPAKRDGRWLEKFLTALRAAAQAFDCPIAGGDTTRQEQILINITVVGELRRGQAILRSGARAGDAIFVTGRLGEAQYGFELVNSGSRLRRRDGRLKKHLFPQPRLAAGSWLASRGLATAMMDLSDGLSSDLPRLCRASGTGARIDEWRLPCVRIAKKDPQRKLKAAELAKHGGDDYELLFTVAKRNLTRLSKTIEGLAITQIGEITSKKQIVLASLDGHVEELKSRGWDPFR